MIQMDFFSKAKKVKTANIELFNFKAICVTYHRCFRPQWNVTYVNFSPSNKKMQKWKFQRSLASEAIIDTQSDPSTQKSANFPQKKYFYVKRRGFQENLALSQISHIKQKIQNLKKKMFKRAKVAHQNSKNIIKAELLTKLEKI